MARKNYDWENGAPLLEHTARKLKVLREYFAEYLRVRCSTPQQSKFRLAVIDGFSGGGRYDGGEPGSPIIFLDTLSKTMTEIEIRRAADGFRPIRIECFFVFNDADASATSKLKDNLQPILAAIRECQPNIEVQVSFESEPFLSLYPKIRDRLDAAGFKNVLFNLDQCGDTHVDRSTVRDILQRFRSGEVFLTFMIKPLLAYLKKDDPKALMRRFAHLEVSATAIAELDGIMHRQEWLGAAEKLVFDHLAGSAAFVSPFSIHNPEGWRYWLMHFANSPRARQVYNDILHANATSQAHFGRAGLEMLSFDPSAEGSLYLFDMDGRKKAKEQLLEDIPRAVLKFGDAMTVADFNHEIYSRTPAHSEDIRSAMFESPDLEILTPSGSPRQKAHTIRPDDILRVSSQRSFFSVFWPTNLKSGD